MLRLDQAQRTALSETLREEIGAMVNALIMIYGIVVISGIVVLLDWLGRRKDRQSKRPKLPF
jgi:hypothetical protein